jgi:hypothetical protein
VLEVVSFQQAMRPELGTGVRSVRHRWLYIAYVLNENLRQVEVIGFSNVHRELARSLAEPLEARRGAGPKRRRGRDLARN